MNHFFKKILIVFCFMQTVLANNPIQFEQVLEPDFAFYEPLFFKFGYVFCADSCDVVTLDQILDYAFYKEASAYFDDATNRVFVQAVVCDEVIGYISCQVIPDYQLYIHHFIIDPDMYSDFLIKDFLFVLFEIMPQVKQISISLPVCCVDLINLLQDLGFVCGEQVCITDQAALNNAILYAQYDLKVPSKCEMCKVLYGPKFWNRDEDFVVGMSDPDDEDEDDDEATMNNASCPLYEK